MQLFRYNSKTIQNWKSNPIRIQGEKSSSCCNAPTVLTQSMKGGFVTSNCCVCVRSHSLTLSQWGELDLWIACPNCSRRMTPIQSEVTDKNYSYGCNSCSLYVWLADLLPNWDDLVSEKAPMIVNLPSEKVRTEVVATPFTSKKSSSVENSLIYEPLLLGVRNLNSNLWFLCVNDEGESLDLVNSYGKRLPKADKKLFSEEQWTPISSFTSVQVEKFEYIETRQINAFERKQLISHLSFEDIGSDEAPRIFAGISQVVEQLKTSLLELGADANKDLLIDLEKIETALKHNKIPTNDQLTRLQAILARVAFRDN
jgi:hypothetical protein